MRNRRHAMSRGLTLAGALSVSAGCGQILGANFDDLTLNHDGGTGTGGANTGGESSGGTGTGAGGSGVGGSGTGGSSVGGTGAGGAGVGGSGVGGTGIAGSDAGTGGVTTGGTSGTGGTATGGITGSGGTISTGGTVTTGGTSTAGGAAGASGCTGTVNGVVINEARNTSGDYIELYNTDCADVDLSGYSIADSSNRETFPTGTILGPKQFLLALGNQTGSLSGGPQTSCSGLPSPCYYLVLGISSGGEAISLLTPALATKDNTNVPGNLTGSTSWGRVTDGTGGFTYTAVTPNAPNHL